MLIRTIRGLRLSGILLLSFSLLVTAAPPQNPPAPTVAAQPAAKQNLPGLPNFGVVSNTLFRGAQPRDSGYDELKKQGIDIVVSFRENPQQIADERRAVEAAGMRFVSIPWSAEDAPRNAQVAAFLELLRDNPHKKVFAHCHRGAERTGVMIATYRIASETWAPQEGVKEMAFFGFRGFWFRGYKKYVLSFPGQLNSDPALLPFSRHQE